MASMVLQALEMVVGGFSWNMVHSMSLTVLCMRSQMTLDCGFFTVVGTAAISMLWRVNWKKAPVNSVPASCTQQRGQGYQESQACSSLKAMWAEVLFSMWMISDKVVHVPMMVRAEMRS